MSKGDRDEWIGRLERLVRRDPAGRGLISSESSRGVLCAGHLAGAAESLGSGSGPVAILTGSTQAATGWAESLEAVRTKTLKSHRWELVE